VFYPDRSANGVRQRYLVWLSRCTRFALIQEEAKKLMKAHHSLANTSEENMT